jgi:hypothetical protein
MIETDRDANASDLQLWQEFKRVYREIVDNVLQLYVSSVSEAPAGAVSAMAPHFASLT